MNRSLLYTLFAGKATEQEIVSIRRWVDASKANRRTFFQERALYDAIQLGDNLLCCPKTNRALILWKWVGGIAVAAVFLLIGYSLSMNYYKKQTFPDQMMNTVRVPAGQRAEIVLSDGSRVWLNARSEFSYPATFGGKDRVVFLKGEAQFDVARNDMKKFLVKTSQCEVEVLGTLFNVDAYEEGVCSIGLLRGSVKVSENRKPEHSIVLEPYTSVCLTNGTFEISKITNPEMYNWREGIISFKDMAFRDLMDKMERNYGVRIRIENRLLDGYVCSGKFRMSDGIETVLKALQIDARFTYDWEDDKHITIY